MSCGRWRGRPGDEYLLTGLVEKYNNTYHCSNGKKNIDASYSVVSVKKYL